MASTLRDVTRASWARRAVRGVRPGVLRVGRRGARQPGVSVGGREWPRPGVARRGRLTRAGPGEGLDTVNFRACRWRSLWVTFGRVHFGSCRDVSARVTPSRRDVQGNDLVNHDVVGGREPYVMRAT
jgi:hypothetical protein